MNIQRRQFLQQLGCLTAAATLPISAFAETPFFEISLAEWSLHKAIRSGELANMDFPLKAKSLGINIVEYVNTLFADKTTTFQERGKDTKYLHQLYQRTQDLGVSNHLIMCDAEGNLGDKDKKKRKKTVENHYKWVEAAKILGCKTIRVNAAGEGSFEEVAKQAADGLRRLSEFAAKVNINVIVENHGGYSSNGQWLSGVMKTVNLPNCGTLPDFGNFCIRRSGDTCAEAYDRYQGTAELMPFAKGVSAKSYDFDADGKCIETDYVRMMKVVKDAGFQGIIGIEYEGSKLSEEAGILKTKTLLETFRS